MTATTRVLLVDDSSVTAKQLKKVIEQFSGYEVVGHAANGAEGVRMYQELKPQVVCMDLVMPLMDGIEAMRTILKLDPGARVVIISSVGGARDKAVEALRLGAKSVIAKPFDPDEVRRALEVG